MIPKLKYQAVAGGRNCCHAGTSEDRYNECKKDIFGTISHVNNTIKKQ